MANVRGADQFDSGVVKASKSVILELGIILRSYFDDLVLIGGWAPYFILRKYQKEGFNHVGSIVGFILLGVDFAGTGPCACPLETRELSQNLAGNF